MLMTVNFAQLSLIMMTLIKIVQFTALNTGELVLKKTVFSVIMSKLNTDLINTG